MPFIDLSNPKQSNPPGVAPLPPLPPLGAQSVAQVAPLQNIQPPVPQQAPATSIATNSIPQNLHIDEGHSLLRDIPADLEKDAQLLDYGIKEMKGPPLNDINQIPAIAPNIQQAPTSPIPGIPIPPIAPVAPVAPDINAILGSSNEPATTPVNTNQGVAVDGYNLSGSAQGKEQEVAAIFARADSILGENNQAPAAPQAPVAPILNANAVTVPGVKNIDLTTADEKFVAQKATIGEFLTLAEKRNASDLHLSVSYPPMLRVDGRLMNIGAEPLSSERVAMLFDQIMNPKQKEMLKKDMDVDFSYTHTSGNRFRINIYNKKGTLAGAFRLIPSRIRTLAELGLPQILYELIDIPQGLIILAGPTGSGKSTTIASMIQEININYSKHIITLEDPIEYIFPRGKALVNQREIGNDATSFQRGLREILRQDPDIVLVGEMRDFDTIARTITAAETGHLVFSTLHTNSASQTVDRIIDVFPDAQQAQVRAQLANVISAVISQRLIPIKGGGRKAAIEIMIATPAIRNAIREAKTYQIDNMIQTSVELGMITMEKSLIDMIRAGSITLDEAQAYSAKPEELLSLMKNN